MSNRLIKYIQAAGASGFNLGKLVVGDSFPVTTSTAMFAVANDWSGNLFVADIDENCIYKITEGGLIRLFAGSPGQDGMVNGTGKDARFQNPKGIACDRSGNVYVADTGNNRIRKIDANGRVTTIAGGFSAPLDVAVAPNGDVIVADTGNHRIYRVRSGGQTLLVAGSSQGNVAGDTGGVKIKGSAAKFNTPKSVAVDNTGNIYVADAGNYQVKIIHPDGWVKVFAGTGTVGNTNGAAAVAQFTSLLRIKANRSGCLYVIDAVAVFNRVKKIDANGNVSTFGTMKRSELAVGVCVTPADKVFVVSTSVSPGYESSSSSKSSSSLDSSASSQSNSSQSNSSASSGSSVSSSSASSLSSEKSSASSVSSASSEKSSASSASSQSNSSASSSSKSPDSRG